MLINDHLSPSTISFFASKVAVFLRLFNLVHRCSVRKVLNLARWDSFFLFLPLDSLFHADTLLNTKFLEVLFELINPVLLFELSCLEGCVKHRFVDVDFAILEVLHFFNRLLSFDLILAPVFFAFFHPILHESLILQ